MSLSSSSSSLLPSSPPTLYEDHLYHCIRDVVLVVNAIATLDSSWDVQTSWLGDAYRYASRAADDIVMLGLAGCGPLHPPWMWRSLRFELLLFGRDEGRPVPLELIVTCLALSPDRCREYRAVIEGCCAQARRRVLELLRADGFTVCDPRDDEARILNEYARACAPAEGGPSQ